MTEQFAVIPAPQGYQLVDIDHDGACDGQIDRWISEPRPVLGFVIKQNSNDFFSVLPVTIFGVHDDGGGGEYAVIRPDGTIDFQHCTNYTFETIDDLKSYLLHHHASVWRQAAQDLSKKGERKEAASWRRIAKKLEDEAENFD
jgi:hypothetical protein